RDWSSDVCSSDLSPSSNHLARHSSGLLCMCVLRHSYNITIIISCFQRLSHKFSVYILVVKEVRTPLPCTQEALLMTPFIYQFVIAVQEHVRDFHPPVFTGPCIVRMFEHPRGE